MSKAQADHLQRRHSRRPAAAASGRAPADQKAAHALGPDQVPAPARPALVRPGLVRRWRTTRWSGSPTRCGSRYARAGGCSSCSAWRCSGRSTSSSASTRPATTRFWTETVFGGFERATPPADLRLDQVPHPADGDLGAVDRDHRRGDRQDHPHHADPGAAPRPAAALARAAVRAADRIYAHVRRAPVRRPLLVHVPRRGGRVLPRRHQDQVLRRLGPGPRARAGQGEHHLPRAPRAGRGARRLRAGRPAAVGAAGNRQDADGRGGGRARPAGRTCSSTPARSSTCSWASASSR